MANILAIERFWLSLYISDEVCEINGSSLTEGRKRRAKWPTPPDFETTEKVTEGKQRAPGDRRAHLSRPCHKKTIQGYDSTFRSLKALDGFLQVALLTLLCQDRPILIRKKSISNSSYSRLWAEFATSIRHGDL